MIKSGGGSKKYKVGYTQGTFDLFHIGHLNIIQNAKKYCDYLIVGVNSDELVKNYKGKMTVINEHDRQKIVENIKGVDKCLIVNSLDKEVAYNKFHFNAFLLAAIGKAMNVGIKPKPCYVINLELTSFIFCIQMEFHRQLLKIAYTMKIDDKQLSLIFCKYCDVKNLSLF